MNDKLRPSVAPLTHNSTLKTHNSSVQASLRRADWRFLLPAQAQGTFDHLVLLGGPVGLAERIVELGLARRVSSRLPTERSADAIVMLHDARFRPQDAARALAPGGVFYLEVDRGAPPSLSSSPGRVRHALKGAGLSTTAMYWATPDFAGCQMYLPLDVRGALAWYLRTLFTAATPARRLIELGLHASALLGTRPFASLVRCYALVAVAEPERDLTPSLIRQPALLAELDQLDLRPLMLTGGHDDLKRVVILPFTERGARPVAVLKLSRFARFNIDTVGEQAVLAKVRSCLDVSMQRTIPRPYGLFRYGEHAVGVESCAPGRSLSSSSGQWGVPLASKIADLQLVARWLSEFHVQAQVSRHPWGTEESSRWIELPLATYDSVFGTTTAEEALFSEIRRRGDMLRGSPFPLVWQHHNFGEWNIVRAGHQITVIDWEHGRAGLPLYDLLHFVTHWSYTVRDRRGEAAQLHGFRELFCEPAPTDPIVRAARAAIMEYMACLDLDRRFLPVLLVYTWVEKALNYFDGQQAFGKAGADGRSGNRSVKYIGILADQMHQLLAGLPTE